MTRYRPMRPVTTGLDMYADLARDSATRQSQVAVQEEQAWRERLEALSLAPALPGESEPRDDVGHLGHRDHFCFPVTRCQCGEIRSTCSFVVTDEGIPPCNICRHYGIGEFVAESL